MTTIQVLDHFCQFFEQLSQNDIDRFGEFYAHQAHFKDPFHEVQCLNDIKTIFSHMFQVAPEAKFLIQHRFINDDSAMIIWTMMLNVRNQNISIKGTSHLVFNEQGLVVLHRDYWDTGEELFSKLPYIGAPTRWLMKQFSALKFNSTKC